MIKGYLVPHPPLIVPGVGKGNEIPDTRRAYEQIAAEIANVNPDTAVVISPHGVMYSDYFHIAPGESAAGDFGSFGQKQIKFSINCDAEFATLISALAQKKGLPAGPLGEKKPALDHGVMVPLYFFSRAFFFVTKLKIIRVSLSGLSAISHYRLGMCIAEAGKLLGRKFVIVASGDMSHRLSAEGPYGFAAEGPEFDKLMRDCIENGQMQKLIGTDPALCENAAECGFKSIVVMAGALDGYEINSKVLCYEGPYGVGYLTASFEAAGKTESMLPALIADKNAKTDAIREAEDEYARLARLNVEHFVRTGAKLSRSKKIPQAMLNTRAGVFVSIKKDGALRGCIGTISPMQSNVYEEILENGVSAASRDPRFGPIEESELDNLIYSVDVLSPAEPIRSKAELDVKRYGVIVRCGRRSGLLLPALDGVDTVEEQISIALKKAGIASDEKYTLERFEVIRHK